MGPARDGGARVSRLLQGPGLTLPRTARPAALVARPGSTARTPRGRRGIAGGCPPRSPARAEDRRRRRRHCCAGRFPGPPASDLHYVAIAGGEVGGPLRLLDLAEGTPQVQVGRAVALRQDARAAQSSSSRLSPQWLAAHAQAAGSGCLDAHAETLDAVVFRNQVQQVARGTLAGPSCT